MYNNILKITEGEISSPHPPKKTSYYIVYLMVSVEQPDDGPIAGPKHVVVIYYIVLFMI